MQDLFGFVAPLQGALDYHLERQNVLATNVAHVDTPGYRPKDVARVDDASFPLALRVALERTSPAHLTGPDGAGAIVHGRPFEDLTAGRGADGNYVSMDREAAKLAANHIRFDVVSAIVGAELRQLAFAANDAKG